MSLDGAMMTGISALDANSQAMSIFSSNIANVNTIGYKDVTANFSDMLSSMFGNVENAGVAATGQQNITQQGLLQTASSPTDMGIEGNGFFVVGGSATAGGAQYYTRVGNFTPDATGNLQNGAGYYLMGWPVGTNGTVSSTASLGPINVSGIPGIAQATQNVTLQGNLDSAATVDSTYAFGDMSAGNATPDFSQTVNIYDSQGGTQPVTINYIQTAANTWNYEINYAGNASNISAPDSSFPTLIGAGQITFNSSGQLSGLTTDTIGSTGVTGTNPSATSIGFTIPWATTSNLYDASNPNGQAINTNIGTLPTTTGSTNGLTQYNSASVAINSSVDGEAYGTVTGVSVDSNGFVTAQFSNGMSRKVFQVPLATFQNANGLSAITGGAYQASTQSGTATIDAPSSGSAGSIQSGELESSTVDLATEFTNLITTQRAYSAAARIVTTADTMLQTLEQLPST